MNRAAKSKGGRCACSRPGVKVSGENWICARCLELDKRNGVGRHRYMPGIRETDNTHLRDEAYTSERFQPEHIAPGPLGMVIAGAYREYAL